MRPGAGAEPLLRDLRGRGGRTARLPGRDAHRSLAAGIVAGLLLAFSYTFWSQAIIAEVYALHLALVGACLIALHAYARKPTTPRLAAFFALYAVSFGNHLSMILFLVPFAVFLLLTTPDRRSLFRPATLGLAALAALGGALQYLAEPAVGRHRRPTRRRTGPRASRHSGSTRRRPTGATRWCSASAPARRSIGSRCGGSTLRQQFGVLGVVFAARRRRAAVAAVTPLGDPGAHGIRDHDVVRADLQRRRLARVLPAVAFPDGVVCGCRGRRWQGGRFTASLGDRRGPRSL